MPVETLSSLTLTDLSESPEPAAALRQGCARLATRGAAALRRFSVEDVVQGVEAVCQRWLDSELPARQDVIRKVMDETGMSRPVVEQGLDVELNNYTADCLRKALESEFGNPSYLDGFQPNPATGGRSWARGPKLIAHWFSSTIPALPALGMVRGLLLKSPGIGRISRREQAFAPAFLSALSEELPGIEEAIWLTTWSPDLPGCLDALAESCDAAIVYGSEETCGKLRARLAPHLDFIEHGHRVGIALLGREALENGNLDELCQACAHDVTTFDQRACISPQVYLVEGGGSVAVSQFARGLAEALEGLEKTLPPGASVVDEEVASTLAAEETRFYGGDAFRAGCGWVLLEAELTRAQPTQGRRTVRVVPVADLERALEALPLRGYLQNVALAVGPQREAPLLDALAEAGASRICRPGKMPYPSMMWHHDGLECLSRLARWTDIEMYD